MATKTTTKSKTKQEVLEPARPRVEGTWQKTMESLGFELSSQQDSEFEWTRRVMWDSGVADVLVTLVLDARGTPWLHYTRVQSSIVGRGAVTLGSEVQEVLEEVASSFPAGPAPAHLDQVVCTRCSTPTPEYIGTQCLDCAKVAPDGDRKAPTGRGKAPARASRRGRKKPISD